MVRNYQKIVIKDDKSANINCITSNSEQTEYAYAATKTSFDFSSASDENRLGSSVVFSDQNSEFEKIK